MHEKRRSSTNVAWYKLADLIARGEREKALSVYRLLAHSLENKAYALQLEGDILWSFDDPSAQEKYKQAAFLYKKEKRWVDAIAVCEHLLFLSPNDQELLAMLCYFYAVIDWEERFNKSFSTICSLFLDGKIQLEQLFGILKNRAELTRKDLHLASKHWLSNAIDTYTKPLDADLYKKIKSFFV